MGHSRKSLDTLAGKIKSLSPKGIDQLNIFNMKTDEIVDEIKRIVKKRVKKVGDFKLK